ncbi:MULTISPECIES: hypothetical protein [unclassified Streptomyces]|uniref:hypothetical protein n=1 Tax=unclassified Streptomyces TaxID=2593676 RepID=UPI00339F4E67
MPKSVEKNTALIRAGFTGERKEAARAGVPRDGSLGLDTCQDGQRSLRALLALGLFNRWGLGDARPPAQWGLHTLVAYDITVSPRYDRLVLMTDVPHNVAPYLLPDRDGGSALPGLRLKEFRSRNTYVAHHLPTGAELVVTGNHSGRWNGNRRSAPHWSFHEAGKPLTSAEREQLKQLPAMTPDATRLLAGLVTRIAAHDPRGSWAVGNWFSDPLDRPGRRNDGSVERYGKELWGAGDRWALRWNGFPYARDIAASLTAPLVGVPGAVAHGAGDHFHVRLGRATLDLKGLGATGRGARRRSA